MVDKSHLPKHHIDTSVIIEPSRTSDGRFCRKYIQRLDYNYRGIISSPVLSELMISMLKLSDSQKRHAFLDVLENLVNTRKVEFYTPVDIHETASQIEDADERIGPTDIDIIACALENKALNLVTLDRKLIGNKAIESGFGLKIMHPKELL